MQFKDRTQAGLLLADKLQKDLSPPVFDPEVAQTRGAGKVVVYGLPRGGVVLAGEIAKALKGPIDLVIPRKIGHPMNPEYAICAVTESGELVCNEAERANVDQKWFKTEVENQIKEAKRRHQVYLKGRKPTPVKGKTAIIVDDGIATGLTMQAAIKEVKSKHPAKVVVAVPVSPKDTAELLKSQVDELVALDIPQFYLGAVGAYYKEFPQVEDNEVVALLESFKRSD